MTHDEIIEELAQFYGTTGYHRWSVLFPNVLLTDGAEWVARELSAYWLMDMVASHLPRLRNEPFIVVDLKKGKKGWTTVLTDGNENELVKQHFEYSDFPLEDFRLYAQYDGGHWVIFLPTEY